MGDIRSSSRGLSRSRSGLPGSHPSGIRRGRRGRSMTRDEILTQMRSTLPATARDWAVSGSPRPARRLRRISKRWLKRRSRAGGTTASACRQDGRRRACVNPGGFGFARPSAGTRGDAQPDIYIPAFALAEAMHGDTVVARVEAHRVSRAAGQDPARPRRVVGRGADASGIGYVVPFDRRLVTDIQIPNGQASSAAPGDMVVVSMTRWPSATRGPAGTVSEVLGRIDEPGVDTQIIIRKFGIPDAHPPEVVAEARTIGAAVRDEDLEGRTDFRRVTTVTIDGGTRATTTPSRSSPRTATTGSACTSPTCHTCGRGRARRGSMRGVGLFHPARDTCDTSSTGLCSLSARGPAGAILPDGSGRAAGRARYGCDGVINSDERMTYTTSTPSLTGERARRRGAGRSVLRADGGAVQGAQHPPPAAGALDRSAGSRGRARRGRVDR